MKFKIELRNLKGEPFNDDSVIRFNAMEIDRLTEDAARNIARSIAQGFGVLHNMEPREIKVISRNDPFEGLHAIVTLAPVEYTPETIALAHVIQRLNGMLRLSLRRETDEDTYLAMREVHAEGVKVIKKYGL